MLYLYLILSFIPWLERRAAEIDSVDEELKGLGSKVDTALVRLAGAWPAEAAYFESLGRNPKSSSIEVEELDTSLAFVGKDEEANARGACLELLGGEMLEAVEGLAHVAGIKCEKNLESGVGEIQHREPPFAAR
jgi:hypothetical protein